MSQIAFWVLLFVGLLLLIANIVKARNAGKPRPEKEQTYPVGSWYVLDALLGFLIILIAFGVI